MIYHIQVLLLPFFLVGGLKGGSPPFPKDLLEGSNSSGMSDAASKVELSNIQPKGNQEIVSCSFNNNLEKQQPQRDMLLWKRVKELRASIPEPYEKHTMIGTSRDHQQKLDKIIVYFNQMSPGAQMLDSTLIKLESIFRGIGQRDESSKIMIQCSLSERHLYTWLSLEIHKMMTPHEPESVRQRERFLERMSTKTDEESSYKKKGKQISQTDDLVISFSELERKIEKEAITKCSSQGSPRSIKRAGSAALTSLKEGLRELEEHERAFEDVIKSDKFGCWLKLKTNMEKVIFGAINYMFQCEMIDPEQVQGFFLDEPGMMEIFGNHLHKVYQIAEVDQFEPTVDFLANLENLTFYVRDCLTKLEKGIQRIIIHTVLARTCQSFIEYCSVEGIAISSRFQEIAWKFNAKDFSGSFTKFEDRTDLIDHYHALFKSSVEYYQTCMESLDGASFFLRPSNPLETWVEHACRNLIPGLKKSRESQPISSAESQLTSNVINLYILRYIIDFWSSIINFKMKKGVKKLENFSKEISIQIFQLRKSGKTAVFFDSKEGLCKLIN